MKSVKNVEFALSVFLIWLVVFVIVIKLVSTAEMQVALLATNFNWVLVSGVVFAFAMLTAMINWKFLTVIMGVKARFRTIAKVFLIGSFVDDILPTITPAGEFTMGYLLSKKAKSKMSKCIASVIMQVVTWFFGFIFFTAVVIVYLMLNGKIGVEMLVMTSLLLGVFSLILAVLIYFVYDPRQAEKIILSGMDFVYALVLDRTRLKKTHSKARCYVHELCCSIGVVFKAYFRKKFDLLLSCLIMSFHHFLVALSFFFVLIAFGVSIDFSIAAGIFILITLVSLLTLLPGQLGIFELLSVTLLSFSAGVASSILITAVVRLIQYWSVILIGGFFAAESGVESVFLRKTPRKRIRKGKR